MNVTAAVRSQKKGLPSKFQVSHSGVLDIDVVFDCPNCGETVKSEQRDELSFEIVLICRCCDWKYRTKIEVTL